MKPERLSVRPTVWRERLVVAFLVCLHGVAAADAQTRQPPATPVATARSAASPTSAPSAPAGWKLIVRAVPNPLPAGRCAGISVELQDPDGYRTTTLSDGSSIDFHKFQYQSTDLTSFAWKDGDPLEGVICASPTATSGQTTLTVTLPDGNSGSATLPLLAPGQTAVAFQYPPQASLRPPGRAPSYSLRTAAAATAAAAGSAPSSAPPASNANPPIGLVANSPAPWPATLTIDGVATQAHSSAAVGWLRRSRAAEVRRDVR
jgi:hypothetical protein